MNETPKFHSVPLAKAIFCLLTILFFLPLQEIAAQSCTTAPSGLISWYRAEGNVNDEQGLHHGSTPYGTTYEAGKVGQSWKNDGFIQSVGLGGNWFGLQTFSFEMWIKAGETQVEHADIIDNNHSAFQSWVIQHQGMSGLTFAFGAADGRGLINFDLRANIWQHLAVTRDSFDTRVYLDGELVGIAGGGTSIFYGDPPNPQLGLGNWFLANGRSFNGNFDEPAFYDRVLADAEISAIYNAGSAGKCAASCPLITISSPERFESGTVGLPYSQTVTSAGGSVPHTYSISDGSLPVGLSLNPTTGEISGTPTAAGTPTFTVTATDLNGCNGSRTYSIEIVQIDYDCPLPGGLIAWYPAEGNADDFQGPTFENGTLQNGTGFAAGEVGQAFDLDGVDDYVDLGNWFDLQTFSFEMWVIADASQVAHANIIDNNHSGFQSWVVQYNNTGGQFYFGALDGRGVIYFDLVPGAWQHLVVTRDLNETKLYLNGTLLETRTGSADIVYTGSQFLRLGAWGGGGRHFNGQIDEPSFYDRAITPTEVAAIYNVGSAGKCASVCSQVTLEPSSLVNGTTGSPYDQTIIVSGGLEPYTFALTDGTIPAGLSLNNETGQISGMPTAAGESNFTITATDEGDCAGSRAYSIEIACATITLNAFLANGMVGTDYNKSAAASGGTGPYIYSVTSGTLPAGLSLNTSTGAITGRPTTAGTYNFTIAATDANGCGGSRAYSSIIAPVITIQPIPAQGAVGTPYFANLVADGGAGPYTFFIFSGALPPGLALTNGQISGTPTSGGSFGFIVIATDSNGFSGQRAYSIAITACMSISLNPSSLPDGKVGSPYDQLLTATGALGQFSFALIEGSLPGGLSLNATTGRIAGIPFLSSFGKSTFKIRATSIGGCSGQKRYTINIAAGTPNAPEVLRAVRTNAVELVWVDKADNEDGFTIERCTTKPSCTYVEIARLSGPNLTSYVDPVNLIIFGQYRYRVRAFNAFGYSPYSNVVSVR